MTLLKICIIFSLAIFSAFFTVYIFFKNNENGKGKWLALSFLALALVNFVEASFYFRDFKTYIANYLGLMFYIKDSLEFFVLPTFLLYLSFYYQISVNWQKHLGPYLFILGLSIFYFINVGSSEAIITAVCHRDLWSDKENLMLNLGLTAQLSVYGLLAFNIINEENSHGFPFKKWHNILLFTFMGIRLITITDNLISIFFSYQYFQIFLYTIAKIGTLTGLFSLFFWELKYGFATNTVEVVKQKYQYSGLSPEQVNVIKQKIQEFLKDKPYLDADFNLDIMAKEMGYSKTYLSQVINQEFGINFNAFINKLRIEESLYLLVNKLDMNINEVFYEVGFNSKSVFNSTFKKLVGCTPSEYRDKHKIIIKI
jgi:AraC-like DNA-binding protein